MNDQNSKLNEENSNYKKEQLILLDNLKEIKNDNMTLQETIGILEMNNINTQRNFNDVNKNYENLLKESKTAEKIVEYKKKVENLAEEKLTMQNTNRVIIESLTNEIKELNNKINEITIKTDKNLNLSKEIPKSDLKVHPKEIDLPKLNIIQNKEILQNLEKISTPAKKQSGGMFSNIVKSLFLTETEIEKI